MSVVAKNTNEYYDYESSVFNEFTLYKTIMAKNGSPYIFHMGSSVGAISLVLKFSGLNATTFEEHDYARIYQVIQDLIVSVNNSDITVQFVHTHFQNAKKIDIDNLDSFLKYRAEMFNKLIETNQVYQDDYYIAILMSPKKKDAKSTFKSILNEFFKKEKKDVIDRFNSSFADVNYRGKVISSIAANFKDALSKLGFDVKEFKTEQEYMDLFQLFTRPTKSKTEVLTIDQSEAALSSPRTQLFSGVRVNDEEEHFILDDVFHRNYTLDSVPKIPVGGETFKSLSDIRYEFIFSASMRNMDEEEQKSYFDYLRMVKKSEVGSSTSLGGGEDPYERAKLDKIEQARLDAATGSKPTVKSSINLVIRVPQIRIEQEMKKSDQVFGEWVRELDGYLVNQIFPNLGRSNWVVEKRTGWPIFLKCIPGFSDMSSYILKKITIYGENFPYLMNLWVHRGLVPHNGVNHYYLESGGFVTSSLMDRRLPGWSYNFSGDPGSGKSVNLTTIFEMAFAESVGGKKPKICIIDNSGVRGSHHKFVELVGGTRVDMSRKLPTIQLLDIDPLTALPNVKATNEIVRKLIECGVSGSEIDLTRKLINGFYPTLHSEGQDLDDIIYARTFEEVFNFDLTPEIKEFLTLKVGQCRPNQKDIMRIMSVFEIMLSDDVVNLDGFKRVKASDIQEILLETYNRSTDRMPYISDFYEVAKEMVSDPETKELNDEADALLNKIKQWTLKGTNTMFDGDSDVDLKADVILVDMKDLDYDKQLKAIYTLLFIDLFSRSMYHIRGRIKILALDEAWSMFVTANSRTFVEMNARTSRKNYFVNLLSTQYITDLYSPDPALGEKLISATNVFLIGKVEEQTMINKIATAIRLPRSIANRLPEMGVVKDRNGNSMYSQFVMYSPRIGTQVIRNILHPYEYHMSSSSEEDNSIMDYYRKHKKTHERLDDYLEFISSNGHIGDMDLVDHLKKIGQGPIALVLEEKAKKLLNKK